jgi:hypothetical protein
MRFFRRRPVQPPIGEAEAYARLHGDRGVEILRVEPMPPPPPKPERPKVTGEMLRRAFESRLGSREDRGAT